MGNEAEETEGMEEEAPYDLLSLLGSFWCGWRWSLWRGDRCGRVGGWGGERGGWHCKDAGGLELGAGGDGSDIEMKMLRAYLYVGSGMVRFCAEYNVDRKDMQRLYSHRDTDHFLSSRK